MNDMELVIPNAGITIKPGDTIRLGRFDRKEWLVGFGWYGYGGNRPVCGWYLTDKMSKEVKPIQLPDLDDIYLVES